MKKSANEKWKGKESREHCRNWKPQKGEVQEQEKY